MYALFAERFGWTPEQADSLPLGFADLVFPILEVTGERQRQVAEREQAAAVRKARWLA